MKNILTAFIFVLIIISSCDDKIDFINQSEIHGDLRYNDIVTETEKPVPAGSSVIVNYIEFKKNQSNAPTYSFVTTGVGKYEFKPQVEGVYTLSFSFTDTIQQYNSDLAQKEDVDTTRADKSNVINYSGQLTSVKVDEDNKFYKHDMSLVASETGLKLLVTDEQKNPLREIKVCIYDNKTYADLNSPYCGGSLSYLSTNEQGEVIFIGLQPKVYYFNARGKIGVVNINNQWSDQMKSSDALVQGIISRKEVVLK